MEDRKWADRFAVQVSQEFLSSFRNEDSAWYESPEDVEEALKVSEEHARLVSWFRYQAGRRLKRVEKEALERYFFEQESYRDIAAKRGTHASTVHRAVNRALRKLRKIAAEEGVHMPRRYKRPSTSLGRE